MTDLHCPVCTDDECEPFFRIDQTPVQEGFLWPTREQAIACECGTISLCHCAGCGHVWNSSFDPGLLRFDPSYDINLYHSASYRDYVHAAMGRLRDRYQLAGKTGLEIACGKGDFCA
jgi:hypothetical protein